MFALLPVRNYPLGALTAAFLGLLLLSAPAAQAAPFAYIANYAFGKVSVLDTATNTITATVEGEGNPGQLAINPAGTRVYVANEIRSNNISVIDTATNTIVATVPLGMARVARIPQSVAVNPAGTRVYVTTNSDSPAVSVIDTASNTVIATVAVDLCPYGVAVNPAGTRVYVANTCSGTVSVIDTASNTVIATVPVAGPTGVAVNPAGTRVYVTNRVSRPGSAFDSVSVIDTASNAVIATVPVGRDPFDVAVNPAGTRVYVTNTATNSVSVIDTTACNAVIATVAIANPNSVAVNPAGTRVYVTSFFSNSVSVIDTTTNTVIATVVVGVALGDSLYGIAIGPGGAPPPVIGPNLRVTGMEVTQGIQDLANSVRLVSGRRTFVRVYVKSDGPAVPGVTATLSGAGAFCTVGGCESGIPLGSLVPVNTVGPRITVSPDPKRSNLNDSFLFELPWQWTNVGSVRLRAALTADPGPPREGCPPSNSDPLYEFEDRTTLRILFVRLGYRLPGTFPNPNNALAITSLLEQQQSESWIRRTYPLSELLTTPDALLFDAGLGSRVDRSAEECQDMKAEEQSLCAQRYITSRLAALQAVSGRLFGLRLGPAGSILLGDADGAYALIPQHPAGLFTRGACCTSRIGAGPSNDADYAAHEIGHFLGRQHPVEGAAVCGHDAVDPDYPYFLSFIAPPLSDPATDLLGFDGGDAGLLIPGSTLSPRNTYDVMGYCNPSWMSDYTYKKIYTCLLSLNSDLPGITPGCGAAGDTRPGADVPQLGDWLMVFGNITPDPATAGFITQRVDRIVSMPPRTPGNHSIRLIGAGGVILADYPFTPEAVEEGVTTAGVSSPALSFGHVVPFVAGTRAIRIVDATTAERVIGAKAVSLNPPVISNVALQGAPNPVTGPVTLGWTANDADGDALTFDIFFARNGADAPQPLMLGLSGRSAQIDTANLGGGSARFRVVASDGVQSAAAESPPFNLANKPPQPRILTPGDGTTTHVGQLVNLEGQATDPQDGVIPDTGLAWSTLSGALGAGPRLSITDLPVGVNRVTLTATNSLGLVAVTTASVTVKDNVDLPGPTLTAGPAQIGWHVGVGELQPQTATLDIGNSGSGNLEFTARSNAPWLTLSTTTGVAPATLILTANPAGFSGGVTEKASVTLTAVGLAGQVITVPVTLSVGNTFTAVCANNVSAGVSVTRSGLRRNSATGRYVQQVTLKNTSATAIPGQVALVLDTLGNNVTLFNKTGNTSCATPVSAYKTASVGADNVLSPLESTTVVLEFTNPGNKTILYRTRVLSGPPE